MTCSDSSADSLKTLNQEINLSQFRQNIFDIGNISELTEDKIETFTVKNNPVKVVERHVLTLSKAIKLYSQMKKIVRSLAMILSARKIPSDPYTEQLLNNIG